MRDQLLGGRYRLVRELGHGGMGQVWEARDETLGRPVAVKVISLLAGGGSRGDQARARFLREARITARLQHPHIVTMHDLGEAGTGGDKVPFLVMELVRGEGLDAKLARGPVTLPDAARWGTQVCDALADAHANGILHRDVKPSNIFVTPQGGVKVLDFGIARAADGNVTAERLTRTGLIVGTPQYLAPEQARGLPEPRSDLYALGCLLFELITGRLPFEAPDTLGYLTAHLTQEPPAPSSVRAGIPAAWDDLVLTLLHKEPAGRYADAAGLARALRRLDGPEDPSERAGRAHAGVFPPPTEPDVPATPAPGEYLFATSLGGAGTVRLWDPATGRPVSPPLAGHTGTVFRMAFSPDGRLLATGSRDETARLWDTATGRLVGDLLTGHTGTVEDVAFSPDGRLLATGSLDGTVRLWDTATGRTVCEPLTAHANGVVGVAFSPDGRLLASSGLDRTVRLWDPTAGRPAGEPLTGHTGDALRVMFSPDGRLLAASGRDWTVRLWDPATGQAVGEPLTGHTNSVWELAFSPDSSVLAAHSQDDDTLLRWDTATGRLVDPPLTARGDGRLVVVPSSGGPLLAADIGEDGTVRLRDAATGQSFGRPMTTRTGKYVYVELSSRLGHRAR
ncbi:serine/threonine protein kinase [Streptomyces sp. WMMC500]|uniref:WD40 repeat domain-containing serine/threonine protein kinase n=1 Tax=Streptomyces sp. WMMC500 TaxID=3015154 RepID=UPI00248D1B6E|nr:serine/threonine-protein kinase [Streptomyces sp. WMMC500]WBB64004.1 serine/threonine protein kinase [Streptomyces sp. WMMC500]